MTEQEIIDGVLQREGGYRDKPGDAGGPTKYGITRKTLAQFRLLSVEKVTAEDVQGLGAGEARAIYAEYFIKQPGFEVIAFEPLKLQMIDFGVNSGPARAIRWLQRVLGLAATGWFDPGTRNELFRLQAIKIGTRPALAVVNDAVVAARSYMIDQVEDAGQLPASDEEGVESRALSWFLAKT
jgi:lysozyme family protein